MNITQKVVHYLKNEYIFLTILSIVGFIYFSFGITSWQFSFVGDEWPFFTYAQEIAEKHLLVNPFELNGVYGENRVLGSVWQALFVLLFQNDHLGWRISNTILIIPLNFFFYFWVKTHFQKKIALLSTVLLTSSFYLANFFKIGYVNPLALVLFVICLYFAAQISFHNKRKDYIFLAVALGMSFYVYIGPLFPFMIVSYFILLLKTNIKMLVKNIAVFLITYISIVSLGFLTSSHTVSPALTKTIAHKEFDSIQQIFINVGHNFLLFYKNYDYFYNHFVSGPYVDLLTGILVFFGTILTLIHIKKKSYFLFAGVYIFTAIIIGITSPYPYTPMTRGIFFLPFGFVFAGIFTPVKLFKSEEN